MRHRPLLVSAAMAPWSRLPLLAVLVAGWLGVCGGAAQAAVTTGISSALPKPTLCEAAARIAAMAINGKGQSKTV